jgi:NADH-quinone oxidoreductase subunit L
VKGLYTLVYNKYFVDEIYDAAVVDPLVGGSRAVLWKGVDAG